MTSLEKNKYYILGIDPSSVSTGLTILDHEGNHILTTSFPVETALVALMRIAHEYDIKRVNCIIEHSKHYQGRASSIAKNAIVRCIKTVWPRRNKIQSCQPIQWRRIYQSVDPQFKVRQPKGFDWKSYAVKFCPIVVKNSDEAESYWIAMYGEKLCVK